MGNTKSKIQPLEEVLNMLGKSVLEPGAYVFNEFERFLLDERKSITIALVGKTGVGKSRLVNSLTGNFKAKEGQTLLPETKKVAGFKTEKHGVEITIWETPGLQDGSGHEYEYLQQISKNVKTVDLLLYCVAMNERIRADDMAALEKVVDKLGIEIWKKSLIVLTFANEVTPKTSFKGSPKDYILEKLVQYRNEYTKQLQTAGVKFDVPFTPIWDSNTQELPICKDWLSVFWIMALKTMDGSIN